ncbi:lipid A biosynthesis acyltransferase [Ectothiorhodospiraceae bacterium 2226]|nr:lipid A biosynthesis acyltransferase [Ectothiorhodospiraceae bacterium 2226]
MGQATTDLAAACGSPRHWPLRATLGLLRAGTRLPIRWQMALGARLGDLTRWLLPPRRRIADANIAAAFPALPRAERRTLVRETFRDTGRALFEGALAWWASDAHLAELYEVDGLEHLDAARAGGRGVILLGGHYTTLELSGRLMMRHAPDIAPVYKPPRNPCMAHLMAHYRRRYYHDLFERRDFRGMLRHLKQGKTLWMAPDQDFGLRSAVFAPFMGVPTATIDAPARLAKLAGAPVLPFYSERLAQGRYRLRIEAPIDGFPSMDAVRDATAINRAIERQVQRRPSQYLWVHKRFRSRPEGQPSLYGK